jgi:CPA2 family monovalent cation:H+ antiporter-2
VEASRPFLHDLALVLGVAAITNVVFRRLRQPVVLGYLLTGVIVGPHTPIPMFADRERIHALSELGVILVMFAVGLEFSVRNLVRLVPTAGIVGAIQISALIWLGYLAGKGLGWTTSECIFAGAIVAVSSTMVVARAFDEARVGGSLAATVYGVLVVQDLAAVLLLAILTAVSSGQGMPLALLARSAGELIAFLVVLVVVGFLIVPRAMRAIAGLGSRETLLVAAIGLCFLAARVVDEVGYSVALGAFLAGSLAAESGHGESIAELVRPVRDVFAAMFFVAVGMLLDPWVLADHWPAALSLTAVVICGQIASVSVGAFLSGRDVRTSIQAGMSLAQIGEFSFIIAGVGVASGAIGEFLYPVTIAVSVVTTFTTPWLIRGSARTAIFVDRHLPRPLQTFVALYATWLEQLRLARREPGRRGRVRRLARRLALDVACLAAVVIGASLEGDRLIGLAAAHLGVPPPAGRWLVAGATIAVSAPFLIGIPRIARGLGASLAEAALPPAEDGRVDLAAAPRRALVVTLQLGLVLLAGVPLLAVTQPFVSPMAGISLLVLIVGGLGVVFWRSATNLEGHVQAGAQMIVEVLGRQAAGPGESTLDAVHPLLPGLGSPTGVRLLADSPAVGKTLAQLNLRALSGATVLSILRGEQGVAVTGHEPLEVGDVLALAGTHDAVTAATGMLLG